MRTRKEIEKDDKFHGLGEIPTMQLKTQKLLVELSLDIREQNEKIVQLLETLPKRILSETMEAYV